MLLLPYCSQCHRLSRALFSSILGAREQRADRDALESPLAVGWVGLVQVGLTGSGRGFGGADRMP